MTKKQLGLHIPMFALLLTFQIAPALAHGDKVVPQVPDGTGSDGTSYITKFDITNLGPDPSYRVTNTKVMFFGQNGNPWTVATNLGTGSEFRLDLGAFQTLRLETLGTSPSITTGYVIIRSSEKSTNFSEDYELAVTVYYEVRRGGNVIDTVSVGVGQPTVVWVFPVQIDNSKNLHTGFAMVNLAGTANGVTLRLWKAGTPVSGNATDAGTATVTLAANEQKAVYLYPGIFPSVDSFRGMLLGVSDRPVAILALLQTPTPAGVQYATMAPVYVDALRRNTFVYLRQGYPLDADLPVSDYTGNSQDTAPWDLLYETQSSSARRLAARSGATFAIIGKRSTAQFDDEVTIETLRGLTYTTDPINLNDNSANLANESTFAIKTALGRYVKVRIADIISRSDDKGAYKDLALELYIYK